MTSAAQAIKVGNAVRALIRRGDEILVLERQEEHEGKGLWYTLPGGLAEAGETLLEALHRNCRRRLGAEVIVRDLQFVREYIADRHDFFADFTKATHEVGFFFSCDIGADYDPSLVPPEKYVVGVKWMRLSDLANLRFFPGDLPSILTGSKEAVLPHYLGDMP